MPTPMSPGREGGKGREGGREEGREGERKREIGREGQKWMFTTVYSQHAALHIDSHAKLSDTYVHVWSLSGLTDYDNTIRVDQRKITLSVM